MLLNRRKLLAGGLAGMLALVVPRRSRAWTEVEALGRELEGLEITPPQQIQVGMTFEFMVRVESSAINPNLLRTAPGSINARPFLNSAPGCLFFEGVTWSRSSAAKDMDLLTYTFTHLPAGWNPAIYPAFDFHDLPMSRFRLADDEDRHPDYRYGSFHPRVI